MKASRLIIAGIVAAGIRYLVNSGFGAYFQKLYDPTSGLWRAMMTPSWIQNVVLANVIIGFLTVFAYIVVNKALGNRAEKVKKGLKFGILMWIVQDVPMSAISYVFMPLSFTLITVWLVSGIIVQLINGVVIAKIYK